MDSAAWAAGAAVIAAVLTWTTARRTADASVSGAWVEYLKPLRADLAELRAEVKHLTAENATLAAKLRTAENELAWLRSLERATALRSTAEGAAVRTSLAGAGITVPELPVAAPRLERSRWTDYVTDSDDEHAE